MIISYWRETEMDIGPTQVPPWRMKSGGWNTGGRFLCMAGRVGLCSSRQYCKYYYFL